MVERRENPLENRRRADRRRERRWFLGTICLAGLSTIGIYVYLYGAAYAAYWDYQPREGDVVFQSLPHGDLTDLIEGVSQSPYSHCGLVASVDGKWVVFEAFRGVEVTPLKRFLFRGRGRGFAVYRLKSQAADVVPGMIQEVRKYMGRAYDHRYRMDDDRIYCSELIYKAFRDATADGQLGEMARLGDLNWRPHQEAIRRLEKGPVPLDREIITPKELARARQLKLVYSHGIAAE